MVCFFSFLSQASISFSQQIEGGSYSKSEGKKPELKDDMYDLDGKKIDINTITEGKVLLNVWASWCITCLVEHPFLKEITQDKDKLTE